MAAVARIALCAATRAGTASPHRCPRAVRAASRATVLLWLLWCWLLGWPMPTAAEPPVPGLRAAWSSAVERRLSIPEHEGTAYARRLEVALRARGLADLPPQFFVLVDRSPRVQAMLLYWGESGAGLHLLGSAPCSTGKPGRYEYFETPLGVFAHLVGPATSSPSPARISSDLPRG